MLAPQCFHLPCIRRDLPVPVLALVLSSRGRTNKFGRAWMLDVATGVEFAARPERPDLRLAFRYLEVPRSSLRVVTGVFCRETTLGAAPRITRGVMKQPVRHRTIAASLREAREAAELCGRQLSQSHQQPANSSPKPGQTESFACLTKGPGECS